MLFAVLLGLLSVRGLCATADRGLVRIGLRSLDPDCTKVVVSSTSRFDVMPEDSSVPILSVDRYSTLTVEAGQARLIITRNQGGSTAVGERLKIVPEDESDALALDIGRAKPSRYRGRIDVSISKGRLRFVNELSVEDYLQGVVPAEMPQAYPFEALKAQAVCARTYAVAAKSRHVAEGFDLCDANHCQVYPGAAGERASTSRAVAETAGMVVTYGDVPASVMYSADAGGMTQDYREMNGNARFPYLAEVTDPEDIPHCSWEVSVPLSVIEAKLRAAGKRGIQGLTGISVGRLGKSGRALTLVLTTPVGQSEVSAEKVRAALGTKLIKSSLYSIQTSYDGAVTFKGKGSGHGVGMCQTGARALAQPPYSLTFDRILAHYFPGTQIAGTDSASRVKVDAPGGKPESREAPVVEAPIVPGGFDAEVRLEEPSLGY